MADRTQGFVSGTPVEAVDGPSPIESLAKKGMPVLTRLPSGERVFRVLSKIEPSAAAVPVVRLSLANGRQVVLAADQAVFRSDHSSVRAGDLKTGDRLELSFHYPSGYRPAWAASAGSEAEDDGGVAVVGVEPAGEEIVYLGRVNETGCLYLTAGILCQAAPG